MKLQIDLNRLVELSENLKFNPENFLHDNTVVQDTYKSLVHIRTNGNSISNLEKKLQRLFNTLYENTLQIKGQGPLLFSEPG